MIEQSKNLVYKTILTGSLSELDEDEDTSEFNVNDFELPIKANLINHETNFPDLLLTETNSTLKESSSNYDTNNNSNNTTTEIKVTHNYLNKDKRVRFDND